MQDKKLGEILTEYNIITEEQLGKALQYQKNHGLLIGEVLIKLGYIHNDRIIAALAEKGTDTDIKEVLVTLFTRLFPHHPYTRP